MPDSEQPDLTRLTVDLLSAYFANNSVPSSELAALIDQTRSALAGESTSAAKAEIHKPAVSVEDSLASKEHILSLIDGKPYKSLKRHLANNGLTPAEYRVRYDLAADYPMVAPAYSEHRRAVAQRMGLGGRPGAAKDAAAKSPSSAPAKPSVSGTKADAAATAAPEAKDAASAAKPPASKAKSSTAGKGTGKTASSTEKLSDAPRSAKKRFAREPQAASPVKTEPRKAAEAPAETNAAAAPKTRGSGSSKAKSAKPAKAPAPAAKSADAASASAPGSSGSAKKPAASKPRNRKSANEPKASKGAGARTNTAAAADKTDPS